MNETLKVELDHAQSRISRDRAVVLCQGSYAALEGGERSPGYNLQLCVDCSAEPVRHTGLLTPAPFRSAWYTNGAGINARLRKTDFTLTSASWHEDTREHASDYWLRRIGAVEGVITTADYPKNCPFWLAWENPNSGNADFIVMEGGYNSSASLAGGVGFRVWAKGTLEVHKSGAQVGQYDLASGETRQNLANRTVGMVILPMRGRELLFWTDLGSAVAHTFDDIQEDDTDPVITPAGKFWWKIVNGAATVQCARCQFPSSGYLISRKLALPLPIEAGALTTDPDVIYKRSYFGTETAPTVSLLETDAVTPFTPDGIKQQCRAKIALAGDGTNTPFVIGALAGYAAVFEDTDGSEVIDLIDYATGLTLDVPDAPAGTTLSLRLTNQDSIDAAKLETVSNRPIRLRYLKGEGEEAEEIVIFDGRTEGPKIERGMSAEVDHLMLSARDVWAAWEKYMWNDTVPLDTATWNDTIIFFASLGLGLDPGITDLSDFDYTIPTNAGEVCGIWSLQVEAGDTIAQWILRLFEDYAAHGMMAIKPRLGGPPLLWIKTPEDIAAQEVEVTIYRSRENAITGGILASEAKYHVFRSYEEAVLAPEAVDIRVSGWDPKLRAPIQSWYQDAAALTVNTPPSARPDNWVGEPGRYALYDPAITRQDLCDEVCRRLATRLAVPRRMAEWTCEMQWRENGLPLWRGDLVEIDGVGIFIVTSLSVDFHKEPNAATDTSDLTTVWKSRRATYTGEFLRESEV